MKITAVTLGLFLFHAALPAFAADLRMIAGQNIKGNLQIGGQSLSVTGAVNAHMEASEGDLQDGKVRLRDLNLRYDNVSQKILTGRARTGSDAGVLGFSAIPTEAGHILKYDREQNSITGTIKGKMDFPQLRELAQLRLEEKVDIYLTPTQDAEVEIKINFDGPIDLGQATTEIVKAAASISINLTAKALRGFNIPSYIIKMPVFRLIFEYTLLSKFEVARNLCLQPVRFRSSLTSTPTGDGWSFGLPGARQEWRKGDVTFVQRVWKTVTSASLLTATEAEMGTILSQVEDFDCIEIFFPEEFSPNSLFGGGATFGSGTASAQIVSSDENAVHGIDLTHLAHELGHVLGLHHPGAGFPTATRPEVIDGSTGTLMCPSGFMNDNPAVNSEENENNVHNPLLTFAFKSVSTPPDCADSADCGNCP